MVCPFGICTSVVVLCNLSLSKSDTTLLISYVPIVVARSEIQGEVGGRVVCLVKILDYGYDRPCAKKLGPREKEL